MACLEAILQTVLGSPAGSASPLAQPRSVTRAAVITWLGNGYRRRLAGARRQVEVLRDGAAAQYGSDAIAGRHELPAQGRALRRRPSSSTPAPSAPAPGEPGTYEVTVSLPGGGWLLCIPVVWASRRRSVSSSRCVCDHA